MSHDRGLRTLLAKHPPLYIIVLPQGLMMHRKYSQERLQSPHGSFLAQQRQALYKRPVPINTSITTSISTSPATSVAG